MHCFSLYSGTTVGDTAITTRKFLFNSRRNINTVYAIFSFPKKPGSYPDILVLYGGGSKAEDVASTVEKYARSGYVAMCFNIADSLENSTLFDAEEASEYLNQIITASLF